MSEPAKAKPQRGTIYRNAVCKICDQHISDWMGEWAHTDTGSPDCSLRK